jgi:putative membrane protein
MLTTATTTALIAPAAVAAHPGWAGGGGPGWWIVFPILWFLLFATVVFLIARRARRGFGRPLATGEGVLGERYARGEIDEVEYRSRLAVLRGEERR